MKIPWMWPWMARKKIKELERNVEDLRDAVTIERLPWSPEPPLSFSRRGYRVNDVVELILEHMQSGLEHMPGKDPSVRLVPLSTVKINEPEVPRSGKKKKKGKA